MPHYVMLLRYTQQGIAKIKDSPARLDAARKAAEAAKGKVHSWYLTMGRWDAVLIAEFPDDETCAKFALSHRRGRQRNHRNSESLHRTRIPQDHRLCELNSSRLLP